MEKQLLNQLKSQSTWRLLGLSIITFFVYPAHYISRQTKILNEYCDPKNQISNGLVSFIFIFAYLSLALFVPYILVEEGHPIEVISDVVDSISGISFIVWGFKARNRINRVLNLERNDKEWFHGFWTFLFSPLYFNFKVNQINEMVEQGGAGQRR